MTTERGRRAEGVGREEEALRERLAGLEQQVVELGNACVVMERVHGALDRGAVLLAIQDVVINVIGSEELAIFEVADGGRLLRPVQSFGVEPRELAVGAGPVGRAASERRAWTILDGAPPEEEPRLTAVAPLSAGPHLTGVVAIWRMLAHKPVFGEADRAVLELLSRHGGAALHLTSPHAGRRAAA
ncbi:GAF domain-containing protein [Anaeromyxobacter diazotrophicus]|uniref:GAF domain-containing protein n=1 Tax=Anaeromyxobacter diazotrophicus TaxID=2590199 RepID=A0A7I9VQZ9_9BACT|nr:GAF domain-containing protein [Anaeromyxobacter diazotrophicus]GEJ58397.1 hypothetical protein AMYX_31380 [Anaeromyxobacter diazotrophicus]